MQNEYVQLEHAYLVASVRGALVARQGWALHAPPRAMVFEWTDHVFFILSKVTHKKHCVWR